jgi:hypothetical protein
MLCNAELLGYFRTLLARQGVDVCGLLVMAAAIGFLGSFIALAMSKWSAST